MDDWEYIDGKWYYFDSSGWMVTGWYKIGDYWYYFESDGVMRTESFSDAQCTYYFFSTGKLRKVITRIKKRTQDGNYWCWAACASMTGKFITGTLKDQRSIVIAIKNNDYDLPASDFEMIDALCFACDYQENWSLIAGPYFDYPYALSLLNARKAFTIHYQWPDSNWHYLVCAGYDRVDSKLRLIDPIEGNSTTYYEYDLLRSGTNIQAGYGWWTLSHIY